MQLARVLVERFGCIERAEVELGPGLNVLYGPNDLGKSSLADAIRFALLVPATSTSEEVAEIRGWTSIEAPRVVLTYKTGPGAWWRVAKTFDGARGTAALESSPDGVRFQQEATARRVEELVRAHLGWGIPAPGGKGGPKGVPRSFLVSALLATQGEVDEILATSLMDDLDATGRQRITSALQALAQDPRFARILARAQEKVDEAYTQGGAWKRGKNDPMTRLKARVNTLDAELQNARRLADDGRGVRSKLQELSQRRLVLAAAKDEAAKTIAELEERVAAAAERAHRETAARAARAALEKIDAAIDAEAKLAAALVEKESLRRTQDARVLELEKDVHEAEAALARAREEKTTLQSSAGEQVLARKRQALEARRLVLDAVIRDAEATAQKAERTGKLDEKHAALEKQRKERRSSLPSVRHELKLTQEQEQRLLEEQQQGRDLAAFAAWRDAERALKKAEDEATAARGFRAEAQTLRAKAAKLDQDVAAAQVPAPAALDELRRLARALELAEGQLAVGLSVDVRPARPPLDVEVARDGAASEKKTLKEPARLDAAREVRLAFPGVAEVVVSGGSDALREKARALRARWETEAKPALQAARAADLAALERAAAQAQDRAREAQDARKEAQAFEARAQDHGDVDAALKERKQRFEDAKKALGAADFGKLADRAAALKDGLAKEVERLRTDGETKLAACRAELRKRELRLKEEEVQLAAVEREYDAAKADLDREKGELLWDWRPALAAAQESLKDAQTQRAAIEVELKDLATSASATLTAAEARVKEAELGLARRHEELTSARHLRDAARDASAQVRGRLDAAKAEVQALDRDAAVRALAAAEATLRELDGTPTATDAELAEARARRQKTEADLTQVEAELHQSEGALGQTGGAVAQEQAERLAAAHAQETQRLAETELDYQAWRLLRDTLRQAETEQGTHLGNALAGPVGQSFKALTDSRYDTLKLGPELQSEAVVVQGRDRSRDRLSIGTREQLATIFRLSLAEHLGSALVLDDQLVQSDADRMGWFAKVLREKAGKIQLVVITCRPRDYLDERELAGTAKPELASADGSVRAIDLGRVVVRGK